MATNKQIFETQMNALASSINTKAGTTGQHTINQLKVLVDGISPSGDVSLQSKTATPSTSSQTITFDAGYDGLQEVVISAVTNTIDANIVASNIRDGVTILGVSGTLDPGINPTGSVTFTSNGTYNVTQVASAIVNVPSDMKPEETKTVNLSFSGSTQTVTPASGKVLTQVTINKPSTLVASNIKSGVIIAGVTGSYVGGAGTLQTKTVTPSTTQQTITPDQNYDGLSSVTVNAVTASIDANIAAGNIRSGVTILGVTGSVSGMSIVINSDNTIDITDGS